MLQVQLLIWIWAPSPHRGFKASCLRLARHPCCCGRNIVVFELSYIHYPLTPDNAPARPSSATQPKAAPIYHSLSLYISRVLADSFVLSTSVFLYSSEPLVLDLLDVLQ